MQPRLTFIAVGVLCLVHICSGQTTIEEVQPPPPATMVIYRPLVLDTTLLFDAPDVVWNCTYMDGTVAVDWFDADFLKLKECSCAETYRKVPNGKEGYMYKLISSVPRASLVRTSDSTFTYTEFALNDPTSVGRTMPMVFESSKVVSVDTLQTENVYTRQMETRMTRSVELRAK